MEYTTFTASSQAEDGRSIIREEGMIKQIRKGGKQHWTACLDGGDGLGEVGESLLTLEAGILDDTGV